jgi:sporulation protein YlmC with PRC-barrel domain
MLRIKWTSVVAIGALIGVLGFAGQVFAGDETPSQQPFRVQKASDLIGKSVENPQGERLGAVQDLAIDAEQQRVAYAVLSFGGFLGMGEKWFAIPTGALTLSENGKHFILAVEKDRLKDASGFEKDNWPKMGNPAWGMEVHKFYGQRPYWMNDGDGSTPTDIRIEKASEIMGRSVQNDRAEKLGEIKDLVIDPDQYRVAYVVLTFGGFMGMGDKLFAIPAGVLQMPGTGNYVVLSVDKDHLKTAKGFDKNNWPNLADPIIAKATYEFYGQKPYWAEDLRGGQYLASAAGKTCLECGHITGARGFVRDGKTYCCAGCANKTGCTCSLPTMKKVSSQP